MSRPRFFLNTVLGIVGGAAACLSEQSPAGPGISAVAVGVGDPTVLNCPALPANTSSMVIGKAGGTLTVGPHTVVIPKGALSKDVLITGSIDGTSALSIQLEPEGLQFNKGPAATLTMSYANCPPLGSLSLQLLYMDDSLTTVLETVPLITSSTANTISGKLKHFSRYAVAY